MINIDSKIFRSYSAFIGVLLFVAPILLTLPFHYLTKNFLPSYDLSSLVTPVAIIFGAGYLSVALPALASVAGASGKRSQLLLIPFAPILGAGIGLLFLGGPWPYLLHVASKSAPVVLTETVAHLSSGHGRSSCRNSITLQGDAMVFRRRLCSVPDSVLLNLKVGDKISLHGSMSSFGTLVSTIDSPSEG